MAKTYQETLDWLYARLPYYQRDGAATHRKISLEPTLTFCQHLGFPNLQLRTVHVGGTNGKGSSSHMVAAVAQAAGYKVGLYTSPHLQDFTERIRINGQPCPEGFVVDFVEEHQEAIASIGLSFFELTVCMALEYFVVSDVDLAVIEVGLGGRLDSTNVIKPMGCLITNIGHDHLDILGPTLQDVAAEKAGIIKARTPVVIGQNQPETNEVFRTKAAEQQAPINWAGDIYQTAHKAAGVWDVYRGPAPHLLDLATDLLGKYIGLNLPGVLALLDVLRTEGYSFTEQHIRRGLAAVTTTTGLKGRWQVLKKEPLTVADVAHNEEGLREVVSQLATVNQGQLHVVIGMVKGKESQTLLQLLPGEAVLYVTQPQLPRALPAAELHAQALLLGFEAAVFPDVRAALAAARASAGKDDTIFIGGSTFVVAELDEL